MPTSIVAARCGTSRIVAVPRDIIETALKAANTAPSGANLQPWHFAVVSGPDTKRKIREAAEVEEREFYEHRASQEWLAALAPLGTDDKKPFLETAPYLIAVFLQKYRRAARRQKGETLLPGRVDGSCDRHPDHGPASRRAWQRLTHTPSPMKFLNEILGRPKSERPFLLLVAGYPADDAEVPDIRRKALDEFTSWVDD